MSKPAARMGDSTAHGGSIVKGEPTVLIGGMPAARVGDMHVCPMLNPGTPPPPHVGQAIVLGSFTVLIGGMPAARVGDMCMCSGPPDSIAMGCMTVLIGDGGGGGGGGGGGAGKGGEGDSKAGGDAGVSSELTSEGEVEDHYLDVKFVDKGGKPVTGVQYKVTLPDNKTETGLLGGGIRKTGLEPGNCEIELKAILNAKWSVSDARVGDEVTLSAETSGIESGTEATISIYLRDINISDQPVKVIVCNIENDSVETSWTFDVNEELLPVQNEREGQGGYSSPAYYFVVEAAGCTTRSPLLHYKDWIELKLKDEEGNAIGDKKYRLYLPNGEVREGTLDSSGSAREDNIPPGKVKVSFDIRDSS